MTSSRPYLIRALYEWIADNSCTPYIVVNTQHEGVAVPKEYIKNNSIVFNIAPDAIEGLLISNTELQFYASFSGVSRHIFAPIEAVMAIYAYENDKGMVFGNEPGGDTPPSNRDQTAAKSKEAKKSHLKIVK